MKKKGYLFLTVALFMMTILFLQSESKAVMTSWNAEQPPEGAKGVEKRTEYRFRDKSTQTSYSTSLGGWTQAGGSWVASGSGQVDYVSSFPSGFEARHLSILQSCTGSPFGNSHKQDNSKYQPHWLYLLSLVQKWNLLWKSEESDSEWGIYG